jgi:hypothetical protein
MDGYKRKEKKDKRKRNSAKTACLHDGLEKFRVVQQGTDVNCSQDTCIIRCELEWWLQMLPGRAVET